MEFRDYYNKNKEKIGQIYPANVEPTGDKYMLIVACFIQNLKGEFLIQKASKNKGSKWGTTSGHPKTGETSLEGMKTEILEELGIQFSDEKYQFVNTFIGNNKILDLYFIKDDLDINKLNLQVEEVEDVKWANKELIEELINKKEFEKTHTKLFKDILDWIEKH